MITPWNFPVAIPSWKCFPALLAGNGIVLKPSEHAPACAEAFVDACLDAGVPDGLVQVVHGYAEPAAALAIHPGVGAVSFTGSVPTGRKVAAAAMETGPRLVSLELGGKNAMVVPARRRPRPRRRRRPVRRVRHRRAALHVDVAPHRAPRRRRRARRAASSKRAGELVLGDPTDPGTDVGPVIDAGAGRAHPRHGRRRGRRGRHGGLRRRRLVDVDGLRRRHVRRADDPRRRAARPPHRPGGGVRAGALGASRSTTSTRPSTSSTASSTACRPRSTPATSTPRCGAVDRIDTGIVYVNAPTIGAEIPLPFGGTKHTGNGFREAGTRGIEQFSEIKTVYVDYSGRLQRAQIDNRPADGGTAMTASTDEPTATDAWLARDDAAARRRAAAQLRRRRRRARARGSPTSTAAATSTSARASASPTSATATRGSSRRSSARLRSCMHTSVVVRHHRNVELAERLGRLTPVLRASPQVFFCNTGAEAVDGAIKLARQATGARRRRLPRRLPRPHARAPRRSPPPRASTARATSRCSAASPSRRTLPAAVRRRGRGGRGRAGRARRAARRCSRPPATSAP